MVIQTIPRKSPLLDFLVGKLKCDAFLSSTIITASNLKCTRHSPKSFINYNADDGNGNNENRHRDRRGPLWKDIPETTDTRGLREKKWPPGMGWEVGLGLYSSCTFEILHHMNAFRPPQLIYKRNQRSLLLALYQLFTHILISQRNPVR